MNTTSACSKPPAVSARSSKASHKKSSRLSGPVDATPENTLQTLQHPSQALDVTGTNAACIWRLILQRLPARRCFDLQVGGMVPWGHAGAGATPAFCASFTSSATQTTILINLVQPGCNRSVLK